MIDYTPVAIAGICAVTIVLIVYICYLLAKNKRDLSSVGHLIVDDGDPDGPADVYLQIEVDPRTFTDGQNIQLEVFKTKHG